MDAPTPYMIRKHLIVKSLFFCFVALEFLSVHSCETQPLSAMVTGREKIGTVVKRLVALNAPKVTCLSPLLWHG